MNRKIVKFSFSLEPFQSRDLGEAMINTDYESSKTTIVKPASSDDAAQVSLSCKRNIVNFVKH